MEKSAYLRLWVFLGLVGACSSESASLVPAGDVNPNRFVPVADGGAALLGRRVVSGTQVWRVDGRAVSAPVDLVALPGHNAFWFAWGIFNGGTSIFGRSESIQALNPPECTFPCDNWYRPACSGGLDCIPPLDDPKMVDKESSELGYLSPTDLVLGVITPEGPRAYPHNVLWWHEVVNEDIGGFAFAVTFCPLTGSGLLFDRTAFRPGQTVRLGVSGRLYNSNLTMWDAVQADPLGEPLDDISYWPQMRRIAVGGPRKGSRFEPLPLFEMTWDAWRMLHPDTRVISGNAAREQGLSQSPGQYVRYPYGDYRVDDGNTFSLTNPAPDPSFRNKDSVFGLFVNGATRVYPWTVLEDTVSARRGVVQDELGGVPLLVVFDLDNAYVHAFDRRVDGQILDFALE